MLKIDIDFLGKYNIIPSVFAVLRGIYVCVHTVQHICNAHLAESIFQTRSRGRSLLARKG